VDLPPVADIVLVVVGAAVAGFVNGLSGAGYSLMALGFWLHAMPPTLATPLAAFCAVASHVSSLPAIWHGVRVQRLWPFLLGGAIGVPLGTALLSHLSATPLKFGIGAFLIVYVSWMAFVRRPPIIYHGGRLADGMVGVIGGITGGMAGASGPAPTVWAQLRGWSKHEQRGVNQPFNMAVLTLAVLSAWIAGFLDGQFLLWLAIALPTTVIGASVGVRIYKRIDDIQFRRVVLTLLALSGASLVLSGLT